MERRARDSAGHFEGIGGRRATPAAAGEWNPEGAPALPPDQSPAPAGGPATLSSDQDTANVLLTGYPASSGVASGPVCLVRSPAEFSRLRPGDVLVAPYTNPAWT